MTTSQKRAVSVTKVFIRNVQHFLAKTGMKDTVLGRRAVQNPRFLERLLEGGTITLDSVDSVYGYMADKGFYYNPFKETKDGPGTTDGA